MTTASVVDLPEPVGPVTSTSPFSIEASRRIGSGMPSCSSVMIFEGITRKTAPEPRCWRNTLTRKRATPAISYARSTSPVATNSSHRRSGRIGRISSMKSASESER